MTEKERHFLPRARRQKGEQTARAPRGSVLAALTRAAAAEANEDEQVRAFRESALRGRLLATEDVPRWVEQQPRPEPSPRNYLVGYRRADGYVYSKPTGPGTVLDELHRIAASLEHRYDWKEPDAIHFVLTGRALPPVAARVRHRRRWHPVGDRVELELHPSLSARRVAQLYLQARRHVDELTEAFYPRSYAGRRAPAAERADRRSWAALAAFVDEVNDGRKWREALKAWNARHKGSREAWRFPPEQVGTFIGHAGRAYRAIFGAELEWKSAKARKPAGEAREAAATIEATQRAADKIDEQRRQRATIAAKVDPARWLELTRTGGTKAGRRR